jgi:hypothetical protein
MIDRDLLTQILTATKAGSFVYTPATAHQPMLAEKLVEVNPAMIDPQDGTKFATRATPAAEAYLANPAPNVSEPAAKTAYQVMTGIELPAAKRRGNPNGGGAPTKYPFATMDVGAVFFSGNSEHKNKDAVKSLGSTVSAQNEKNAEQLIKDGVPQTKTITRAVRDKTTKKAAVGPDGKKITETVELPVKKYNKKFTIRPVAKGYKSGNWEAPEDGALIGRIL